MVMPVQRDIEQAAALLHAGQLVAFPTETVYGVGADARNADAVARIYRLKGRPADHPLIVHLAPEADPGAWVRELPLLAVRLIERFWPGPLTLILHRQDGVPDAVSGGQDTVGLRCPAHPVAQQLLRAFAALAPTEAERCARGVAAPSANRFGRISPTTARHVRDEFGDAVHVLDGGACPVGIESTILDLSRLDSVGPVLLRPGSVTPAMLAEVLGEAPCTRDAAAPRASGTLAAHYAPRTPLRLVESAALPEAPPDAAVWSWSMSNPGTHAHWHAAPGNADDYARQLYAMLRELDRSGVREIWIERPPSGPEWAGIQDRLQRAAAAAVPAASGN